MSTNPLVPVSTPSFLNDINLNRNSAWEYCPVTFDGEIDSRYANLKERTKHIIRYLWGKNYWSLATRLATCSRHGSVYKACKKGKKAKAHRHTCHSWLCHYCGLPWNMMRCWLRKRSEAVLTEKQVGIEIVGPLGGDIELAGRKMALWFGRRGADSVRRLGVEIKPRNVKMRLVAHMAHLPYRECSEYLRASMGPGWALLPHREPNSMKVLLWMFSSSEGVLKEECGKLVGDAFLAYKRHHLIKTHGDFYRASANSIEHNYSAFELGHIEDSSCNCGFCDGVMEDIPHGKREIKPIEEILEQYEHVEWSCCYDPFRIWRNHSLTLNIEPGYTIPSTGPALAPSPPPW